MSKFSFVYGRHCVIKKKYRVKKYSIVFASMQLRTIWLRKYPNDPKAYLELWIYIDSIAPDKAAYCVFTQFRGPENAIKLISVRTKTQ